MMLSFRIECPKCQWGHPFKDRYINNGFLIGKCSHCGNKFYFKITVTGVDVKVQQENPVGQVCKTLEEAK